MSTKSEKPQKGNLRRKSRDLKESGASVNPDEVISEINHQSTALQKIVSRFLDPVDVKKSASKKSKS